MQFDITPKQLERFWTKIDRSGGPDACWPWLGSLNAAGYGTFAIGRGRRGHTSKLAHRLAYYLTNGRIPDDAPFILHGCDNPQCCNPGHLRAGTRKDNAEDRETRGRGGNHRGDANGRSKLTPDDIIAIRAAYTGVRGQQRRLAEQYNVTPAMIRFIVHRLNWRHI